MKTHNLLGFYWDSIIDAFHLNSTGPFGTRIYFLTKLKYVAL